MKTSLYKNFSSRHLLPNYYLFLLKWWEILTYWVSLTLTKQKNLPQKQRCIIRRWKFVLLFFTMPGGGGLECKEQYTKRVLKRLVHSTQKKHEHYWVYSLLQALQLFHIQEHLSWPMISCWHHRDLTVSCEWENR